MTTTDSPKLERKRHLINVIRVWLNRAENHTEEGRSDKALDAIANANEALNQLEPLL